MINAATTSHSLSSLDDNAATTSSHSLSSLHVDGAFTKLSKQLLNAHKHKRSIIQPIPSNFIMASPDLLDSPQRSSNVINTSIKELSSSGTLTALPSAYTLTESQAAELNNIVEDAEIPVIDFSLLTAGTPDQRSQAIRDLGRACEDWGFFVIVNHGIPNTLRNGLVDAANGFFDLPAEEKQEYSDTHALNPIRYGTSFNSKVDEEVRYWRDYLKIITHPEFHCPTKPPEFREVLKEYAARMRELGRKLLGGIWESLGLDEKYMSEALNLDSAFQLVACNLYPPCPQPELAMGLPPHSDHGIIVILCQNNVNGLEIQHNGKWVRVKPLPDSYLINTGDHMEIISNGKYKSVLHRAVVNGGSTRMSIVSPVCPSLDTVVEPAPPLVSSDSPAAYRGMKYGDFMEYQQNNQLKGKSVLSLLRV